MRVRGLCISILMNTTPGPRMSESDRQRLSAHARDVVRRLELEPDPGQAAVLESRLRRALEQVALAPTDTALALFVSDATIRLIHLPVTGRTASSSIRPFPPPPPPATRPSAAVLSGAILGVPTVTGNGAAIAGLARGIRNRPRLSELEDIGRLVMEDHVADLGAAAHDTFHARLRTRRAVTGLLGCWHAASTGTPELLVVEQHFAMPARMVAGGRYLEPSDDGEHPDVIDDAVDDLIERVLQRGGFVSVVPDGTLRDHGRVALTLAQGHRMNP